MILDLFSGQVATACPPHETVAVNRTGQRFLVLVCVFVCAGMLLQVGRFLALLAQSTRARGWLVRRMGRRAATYVRGDGNYVCRGKKLASHQIFSRTMLS